MLPGSWLAKTGWDWHAKEEQHTGGGPAPHSGWSHAWSWPSDSEPPWLHSEEAGMVTQGSFRSFHHMVFSNTGQIIALIILKTDQSCFRSWQGSISDLKVTGKEVKDTELCRTGGTRTPAGLETRQTDRAQVALLNPGGIPSPQKIRHKISFYLLLDVEKELRNAFWPEPKIVRFYSTDFFTFLSWGRRVNMFI